MTLFAGVDVGQSSTRAILGDERGTILSTGSAGAGDEVGQDKSSTRLHDAVESALQSALSAANVRPDAAFESVVIGLSGYEGRITGRVPEPRTQLMSIVHDAVIAHAGAFWGGPGVVVIAGTGSAAYGRAGDGEGLLLGGWGYLFGDEGSSFALVRGVLMEMMNEDDRGAPRSAATDAVLAHFRAPSVRALARSFYSADVDRTALAACAPVVLGLAERGDACAVALVEQAAIHLCVLASTAARRLRLLPAPVAFVGGALENAWYSARIDAAIGDMDLPLERRAPHAGALRGALFLAYEAAGIAFA